MKKEIQNFEELESFLKKHNYTYPKIWKSKLKIVKRKDRNSSTWKDCRMSLYGSGRTSHCLITIMKNMTATGEKINEKIEKIGAKKFLKLLSKYSLTIPMLIKIWREVLKADNTKYFNNIIKKGGKSYYKRQLIPETLKLEDLLGLKIPLLIKLPKKKDTIIRVMEEKDYWDYRHIYLGKPKEDQNNINIIRKETQEYFKSVCTYIKQPKYSKNYFISHSDQKSAEMWTKYWKLYLKVC